MYEAPMLVETGSFADLTRRCKRGKHHDYRHHRRYRRHGGHDD